MKVLETIREDDKEGFMALFGKTITCFCMNYIYTGKLVGVNETQIKLESPKIVYETGPLNTKEWKDAQNLPQPIYLRMSAIESYMILK